MDTTFLILPKCAQASLKSNCTQPHLPFSSLIYSLSGYRHLFALLPRLVDYPIFINPSFPLHPFLLFLQDAAISSGCCYFFRYAVVSPISLLLSELYQLIYIFKLMEGKLMLTHTLYSGGTRGQKWRPRQRGSRRMDVDRKIRNSWLFMFQK